MAAKTDSKVKDKTSKKVAGPKTTAGLSIHARVPSVVIPPSPLKRQKIAPGSGFNKSSAKKFNSLHYEELACGTFVAHLERTGPPVQDPYWIPTKFKVRDDEAFRNRVKIDGFLPMVDMEGEPMLTKPDSGYNWEMMACYSSSTEGLDILAWAKTIARVFNQHGTEPKVYKYGFKCQVGKNRTHPKKRTIDLVTNNDEVIDIFKKAYDVKDNGHLLTLIKDEGNKAEIETFFRDHEYGKKAINAYLLAEDPFYLSTSDVSSDDEEK